jgi:hypothetical protein
MCCVTMLQMHVYRITSESPQKRTGVFSLEHNLASRMLLWEGRVAPMQEPPSQVPRALVDPGAPGRWQPRNDLHSRSLQRHLAHFNLPAAFTEWASLAQDRAG